MNFVAEGKDTHWWDWEQIPKSQIPIHIKKLSVVSNLPQQRTYKISKFSGKYNFEGLRDLYKTLLILQTVVVLEPQNYKGYWSLVVSGNSFQDKNQFNIYNKVNLLFKGKVKTLLDGKKLFLGVTQEGEYIPVKLVEVTSRKNHKNMVFV